MYLYRKLPMSPLTAYYTNWGLLSSMHIALKDFAAVIFWTVGYVLVADDHQVRTYIPFLHFAPTSRVVHRFIRTSRRWTRRCSARWAAASAPSWG